MMKLVVLTLLLLGVSLSLAAPPEAATADEVDIADLENAEDDPELYSADCSSGDKYLPFPRNCNKYYQCSNGEPYELSCPAGLYFSVDRKYCDWPSKVYCERDRCDRRRIGRDSGSGDDDESRARCANGYVPVACYASDPARSDGTEINGRDCVAVNSFGNSGQRAFATCVAVGNDNFRVVTSGEWERNPVARCTAGYQIINCLLRNAWNHVGFAFPKMTARGNICSSDRTCSAGRGCRVQAVCRRVNSWSIKAQPSE